MNSRLLCLGLTTLAVAVAMAACSTKKTTAANSLTVNNAIYVTGNSPNRILVVGDNAYIVSFDGTVDQVNLDTCTAAKASCQRTGQTVLPVGADPYDMIFFGGNLWVSDDILNVVYEISTSSMAVIATATTGEGFAFSSPESFGIIPGPELLVSNANYNANGAGPGFVSVVAGTNIVAQFSTSKPEPQSFATWPTGVLALVDDGAATFNPTGTVTATTAGAIDLLNAGGTAVASSIPMGLILPGPGLAFSANEQSAFAGSGAGGFMIKIDVGSLAVTTDQLSSLAASSTTSISDVVEDPSTHILYALSYNEDRVYAVNEDTLAPVTLGSSGSFVSVGPGLPTAAGPDQAVIWQHDGVKHLLVLLTGASAVTDILIP